ncbi:hypothetical protein EPO05_06985 [Patescibacteria group bacterium]|nr:MAG: hypothetical protein EPO05_06985 [Patescibacteria group bacterium]
MAANPLTTSTATFPSISDGLNLAVSQTRNEGKATGQTINSPSPAFQDMLAGNPMSAVRFLAIRVSGGTLILRVSSPIAGGANQLIPISDLFLISNPLVGSEFTAVGLQGSGSIEMVIAGDT